MMRLIYKGRAGWMADEIDGDTIVFEDQDGNRWSVSYGDLDLIVDPTDDQLEAALAGEPIPDDPEADAELAAMLAEFMSRPDMASKRGAYMDEICSRHGVPLRDCPEECPLRAGLLGNV